MSETDWMRADSERSWSIDTPVGRAMISQLEDGGRWVAQLDVERGTRQSEWLESRDEAEAWIESQVEAVQRESDVAAEE